MAGRVYISFLGTSNYVEFVYKIDGKESSPTRFIQEALVEKYCKDWGEGDAILIFATATAKKRNWQDNGHKGETNDLYNQGLETRFKGMTLNPDLRIDCIKIPEVESQEDIWELFNIVNDEIKSYKEIYFDITHAYRFIPMFAMSLFNYSQFVNGTNVVSVKYAMLNYSEEQLKKIRKDVKLENRDVQEVLDLTSLIDLQDYTQIASDLKTYGRLDSFATSVNESESTLSSEIKKFDEYIQTNNLGKLRDGEYVKNILFCLDNTIESLSPLTNIKQEIKSLFDKYGFVETKSYRNVIAAINWAKEYEMLPQSYTLLEELMISIVVDSIKDLDKNPYKQSSDLLKFREFVGALLGLDYDLLTDYDQLKDGSEVKKNFSFIASIFSQRSWIKDLKTPYKRISARRNNLNHANGKHTYRNLLSVFESEYSQCIEIINNNTTFLLS